MSSARGVGDPEVAGGETPGGNRVNTNTPTIL